MSIMLATAPAALDLPLHVPVREREDGKAVIAFHPVAAMLRRDRAVRLELAQRVLVAAVMP